MHKENNILGIQIFSNSYSIGTFIDFLTSNHESIVSNLIQKSVGKSGFENFLKLTKEYGDIMVSICLKNKPTKDHSISIYAKIEGLTTEEVIEKLDKETFNAVKTNDFWKSFKG